MSEYLRRLLKTDLIGLQARKQPLTIKEQIFRSEIDDFRSEALGLILPLLAIVSFCWGLARGFSPVFVEIWPPFAIFLICVAGAFSHHERPRRAAFFLITALSWILLATAYLWRYPFLAFYMPLLTTFACLMLEGLASSIFALQLTLALSGYAWLVYPTGWLNSLTIGLLVGVWLAWAVIRLAVRPFQSALRAARADREWALRQYESGKGYQSELRQALKQLECANYQIRKQNQILDQARFEAEQARKAKNEFAAIVSHELLTPINLIAGYSEMICKSPRAYGGHPLPLAYQADAWAIYHSATHLRSLITDVLDLARLDTGKTTLNKEIIDPRELLYQTAEIARDLVAQKGLELIIDAPDECGVVLGDVKRLRQVWLNLIKNAVRFTSSGYICLRLTRDAQQKEIWHCVEDTGIGIQAEDIQRLFQPFEQLSNPLNRTHEGAGLGLSLCKSFIEEHKGRIWVESQVGQGSKFYFALDEFHPISDSK